MAVLDKAALLEAIAAKPDVATKAVDCPELGGEVLVREMTGSVRNRMEAAFAAISEGANGSVLDEPMTSLLASCVVDEGGRPFLPRKKAEELIKNHPRAAFRIRDAVMALSGTTEKDAENLAESFG